MNAPEPLTRPWTPEDTAPLAKLLRDGNSYEQIAHVLKRSEYAIRNHARRLAVSNGGGASGGEGEVLRSAVAVNKVIDGGHS